MESSSFFSRLVNFKIRSYYFVISNLANSKEKSKRKIKVLLYFASLLFDSHYLKIGIATIVKYIFRIGKFLINVFKEG